MLEWINEYPYVAIVLLTLIPALELRASIPCAIKWSDEPVWAIVLVAVAVNITLGPILYLMLDKLLHLFLRIGWINRIWDHMILRTQKKIHPYVEKYGTLGLSVFIGIPLPGSGVYSGAVGGYLLGFTRREFYIATVFGVLIAAGIVTAVMLTGSEMFSFLVKIIEPS